jgi:glycosyltransferase A (GT-A) superfamily protein (DUF2064 family)
MSAAYLNRIVVLAKAPIAGRSKTRLTPPYTPEQAAAIAEACLHDTLDTVRRLVANDETFDAVLCLDGEPGPWLPAAFPVIPQCTGGHDARIARAIERAVQPAGRQVADAVLLVGMDTPQVTPQLFRSAARMTRTHDAAFAPAYDGGWWLLGLQRGHATRASDVVLGVPTSTAFTGALQRKRLQDLGLSIGNLPVLRDIDTAADIEAVRRDISGTAGPRRLAHLTRSLREEAAA